MENNNLQQQPGVNPYAPQPTMQGTSWDGYVAPHLAGKNKKSKKGLVIGIIIAAAVLVTSIGGFIFYKLVLDTPRVRLARGFANMAREMAAYDNKLADKMAYGDIKDRACEEPYSEEMHLNISSPDFDSTIDTIGFDVLMNVDIPNAKMNGGFEVSIWNAELLSGNMAADEDMFYISIPTFTEDTYFFDAANFGKKFNESEWSRMLNQELEEDFSFDVFDEVFDDRTSEVIAEEYKNTILADWKEMIRSATIEDSRRTVEIERNGKTLRCGAIKVVLEKEDVNLLLEDIKDGFLAGSYMEKLIDSLMEENNTSYGYYPETEKEIRESIEKMFTIEVEEDPEIYFYLDGKNRIVSIEMSEMLELESELFDAVGFKFDFLGSKRTLDEISGVLELESEGETVEVVVERNAWRNETLYEDEINVTMKFPDDDFYSDITLQFELEWDVQEDEFKALIEAGDKYSGFAIKLKGYYTDIVKGERFTLNIGQFSIILNDEEVLRGAGTYSMAPFDGEIEIPQNAIDAFRMDESEIQKLAIEIFTSISELYEGL